MRSDFSNVINLMTTHSGPQFYEQSAINYYFNKKGNINYDVFTSNNYVMFPNLQTTYLNKIIHFCGAGNNNKLEDMTQYKNKHFPVTTFDTRTHMFRYFCSQYSDSSPRMLEIGVFKGKFLQSLTEVCPHFHIDGVDIFQGN